MVSFGSSPAIRFAKEGPIFHPQDLARMRHAYDSACHDGVMPERTDAQRTSLAKAIVTSYRSDLTEQEIVLAARNLVK